MDPHASYFRAITGEEAETQLKKSGHHCYLTRFSERKNCYVLSVYQKRPYVMKHFHIVFTDYHGQRREYQIEGTEEAFGSLDDMLRHYEKNQIDPSLMSIGQQVTFDEFSAVPP